MAADSQTEADAWNQIQDDVQDAEDVYRDHYDDDRIVRDDDTALVIAAPSNEEYEPISEEAAVSEEAVSELMHEHAERLTDYNWGFSYPVVVEQ